MSSLKRRFRREGRALRGRRATQPEISPEVVQAIDQIGRLLEDQAAALHRRLRFRRHDRPEIDIVVRLPLAAEEGARPTVKIPLDVILDRNGIHFPPVVVSPDDHLAHSPRRERRAQMAVEYVRASWGYLRSTLDERRRMMVEEEDPTESAALASLMEELVKVAHEP